METRVLLIKSSDLLFLLLTILGYTITDTLEEVRLGGVFDNRSTQALTAFRYKVHRFNYNSNSAHRQGKPYRLNNDTSILDITDTFAVSNALCHHLSRGDLAIVGVSNASSLSTIQSYTETFRVPFLTISMALNDAPNSSYVMYMRPLYTDALVDLMIHFRWVRVAFYYDSDEGLVRLQQVFQAINEYSNYMVTIDIKRIQSVEHAYQTLKQLHRYEPEAEQRVLLDVRIDEAEKIVLKVMHDKDINNARFHFLLGDLGILEMNMTNFRIGGMNITGFQLVDPRNQTAGLFLSEWAQLDSNYWPGAGSTALKYETALIVDAVNLFTRALGAAASRDSSILRPNRYSRIAKPGKCTDGSDVKTRQGKQIMEEMKKVQFDGVTGHVAFDEKGHRKDFTLDIYDIALTRRAAKIGYWTHQEGKIEGQPPRILPGPDEANVNGTRIVTTIRKAPYVMFKKEPKGGIPLIADENLEGYCIDLTRAVARKVGFEYKIKFVTDGSYGQAHPNGSWDGIVGELIKHEADMAIATFTITAGRSRVIDFTKPFMSLGISIMIKRPTPPGKRFFSFMDPLSYEIWMCIVFAYIGVSVVLFLVSRFSPNEWHVTERQHYVSNDFSISNSLWFSLGAFMQQGCDISPKSMSGRIVGSVWWFFTLIIISSYTANLAAFLTVERMLTPIDSAEDLARQTDIQYGTIDSGATKSFFKHSQFPTYKRMWSYMTTAQPTVFVQTHEKGIDRVRSSQGKYAYLTESTTIEYVSSRKPCDTLKVGNNLNSNGFGIGTPVGSDLKNALNFAVLELRENGDLAKWEKNWFDNGECPNYTSNKDGGQSALSLASVAGIFCILIGGLTTAILSAAIEFLYKSKNDASHSTMSFGCALRSKARLSFRGHSDNGPQRPSNLRRRSHNSVTYTYTGPTNVMGSKHGFDDPNSHTEV